MDGLDSLRLALSSLERKEHRVAARLFRDVIETMGLAAYFKTDTAESAKLLRKWYSDTIVPHKIYRDHIKKTRGDKPAEQLAADYSSFSKFTHRSYRAILDGYILGVGDRIFHDKFNDIHSGKELTPNPFALPQTISSYFAVLSSIALQYCFDLPALGLVDSVDLLTILGESLETETVPRRFFPRSWLSKGGARSEIKDLAEE